MTGFVDPEFRKLKPSEPNFLVWRISKDPEENWGAKLLKSDYLGYFFDEDSYIVYSAKPVKTPPGTRVWGSKSKMEIHLHFWLGSQLTEEERNRTIVKAIELDEVLEGAAVLHREMQGSESNRFLSYFGRVIVKRGEIASVLTDPSTDTSCGMYLFSERAHTFILTETPQPCWLYVNSRKVFLLKTHTRMYLWLGKDISKKDEDAALKMAERSRGTQRLVTVRDGEESALADEDLKEFNGHLHPMDKLWMPKAHVEEQEAVGATFEKALTLYSVFPEELDPALVLKRTCPLRQSDLAFAEVAIVDHRGNDIWVWVSRTAPEKVRNRAVNIGIGYSDRLEREVGEGVRPQQAHVARVVGGAEPAEFKLLFCDWLDELGPPGLSYFGKKAPRPVNVAFLEDEARAAATQLVDFGGGTVNVMQVRRNTVRPLARENCAIFHARGVYLVEYRYQCAGREKMILYLWLGRDAQAADRDDSMWNSFAAVPELQNAQMRVRVEQGEEPPHFRAIFGGKMIVLTGSKAAGEGWAKDEGSRSALNQFSPLVLDVRGSDPLLACSVQVEADRHSLGSHRVLLYRRPDGSGRLWFGRKSTGDQREVGKGIARRWCSQFEIVFDEGDHETEPHGFPTISADSCAAEVAVPARTFACYRTGERFSFEEVVEPELVAFHPRDVVLVDARTVLFVWYGRQVPQEERFFWTRLAADYLAADPCCRSLGTPVAQVEQDNEPSIFSGLYQAWSQQFTQTVSPSAATCHRDFLRKK